MPTYLLRLIAITVALVADVSAVDGQARAHRIAATVVLADEAPAGARFLVKRIPGASRADLIILPPDATAADLSDAVRTLLTIRQKDGDVPGVERTVRLRPGSASRGQAPFPWAARVLGDVTRSSRISLDDLGDVRTVQIWLPPRDKRPTAKPATPRT